MGDYKREIRDTFTYHGAGFAVVLRRLPMLLLGTEWVFDIKPSAIDRRIFERLPHQASRLTGYQVRFIRIYADMTLKAFAHRFGVSHPAVLKWERAGDSMTNMSWSTEKDIRLFVLSQSESSAQEFQAFYEALTTEANEAVTPLEIDIEELVGVH